MGFLPRNMHEDYEYRRAHSIGYDAGLNDGPKHGKYTNMHIGNQLFSKGYSIGYEQGVKKRNELKEINEKSKKELEDIINRFKK